MSCRSGLSHNPGLYIHVPFCRSKCRYCGFYSVTSVDSIPGYIEALCNEMEMYQGIFGTFDTVYFGGGTPTVLPPHTIETILAGVRKSFALTDNPEITVEANPQDLDMTMLTSLFDCGVNRLNIGVQSFNDDILSFLGRRHTVATVRSALDNARLVGFTNIGIDLMYAIPHQSIEEWFATLDQALMAAPEHISCYELTIDTGTPLKIELESGAISLPDEDLQFDFFIKTSERLENAGYVHYEVSNFAGKLNLASRHNRKYWDHVPYLGLGPSAHSFLHNRRWWNHRSLSRYLDDLHKAKKPVDETETLTDDQLCLEALSLGLRTKKGINLTDFKMKYHVDLLREKNDILARLKDEGLIDIENGTLSPTRFGLAVADTLPLI